jgi:hypothetical protein
MDAPPPNVISPPLLAVVWVILDTGVVVTFGRVKKEISLPYAVPLEFTAYALR